MLTVSSRVEARSPVNREEWVSVGLGVAYPVFDRWSNGWSQNVSYSFGKKCFYQLSFTYTKAAQQRLFYNMSSIGLGFGYRLNRNLLHGALFVGPNLNLGRVKNPDRPNLITRWSSTNALGVFSVLQMNVRIPAWEELGLGFELYGNVNRAINNYGFRFVLFLNDGSR
jgi:hypothetical protein